MRHSGSLRTGLLLLAWCMQASAGYCHYFTWHQQPGEVALRECVREMRLLVAARKDILAGPDSDGQPEIKLLSLAFNGIGDLGHEPFIFPGDVERAVPIPNVPSGFNSPKTAGKPYDEVVTACLIVARDHFPPSVLGIGSDGSWKGGDWLGGANLYRSILHRVPNSPIGGEVVPGKIEQDEEPVIHSLPLSLVISLIGGSILLYFVRNARPRKYAP